MCLPHNGAWPQYGISEATLESMYRYAKFQFECGNYAGAAEVRASRGGGARDDRMPAPCLLYHNLCVF